MDARARGRIGPGALERRARSSAALGLAAGGLVVRGLAVRGLAVRAVAALCSAVLLLTLAGCATSAPAAAAPRTAPDASKAVELRYRAFAQGLSLGLVNESHSSRVDVYSERKPIDRATTKVSPDEVVDAIVEYFRDNGYFEIAVRGAAPANPPAGATQVLEVVLPDGPWHALARPGVTADFARTFQACRQALLDVYSATMQLQAVDEAPAWRSGSPQPPRRRSGGG
jgi:hypothetical protein